MKCRFSSLFVHFDLNPCIFFQIAPASLRSYHMDSSTELAQWKVLDITSVVMKDIHLLDNTHCTVARMARGMVQYPYVS